MAKTLKMPKAHKEETPQVTLKTFFEEDTVTKNYHVYRTEFHEIRITDTRIDTFLRSIRKSKKDGSDRLTKEDQHLKMCEFVIGKSKPLVQKMRGVEWEASIRSLLKKVFKEDFDRDDFENRDAVEEHVSNPSIAAD